MIDIKQIVEKDTLDIEKQRSQDHISSGRLSASMLGQPLQWQILKWLGVTPTPDDIYTQLIFRRGRDVEDFIVDILKKKHDLKDQTKCLYKDVIGFLDVLIEFADGNSEAIEIKSTNSMAFKHILKEGKAKRGHALQGALYGLALDLPEFNICYVNTDNYQIRNFRYKTKDYKKQIDQIIDDYEACKKRREIPVFQEIERWNKLKQYCKYPDFLNKEKEELYTIAEVLYSSKI